MLVSVIIPAYNCKNSLENTVNSILHSGMQDFEIVIIDDGSVDDTATICDSLEARHSNIRCFHQKNSGVSSTRNVGIEAAKGEYILFFDSDDTVDERSLERACEIVKKQKPSMLIYGLSFDYYLHGKMYRRDKLVYTEEAALDCNQWADAYEKLFACNALSPVWNKFIKRDILMEHEIRFRKDLIEMEDFLFVVQCMKFCDTIYMLPEDIYRYRQAENERSTYNRLKRISSLAEYMSPFAKEIEGLEKHLLNKNVVLKNGKKVVEQIYQFLFFEQTRFGDVKEIRKAAEDMISGKYAYVIKDSDPALYQKLENGKYYQVWIRNRMLQLRHWLAIRVKYIRYKWRD